jgi:hypothetical protein
VSLFDMTLTVDRKGITMETPLLGIIVEAIFKALAGKLAPATLDAAIAAISPIIIKIFNSEKPREAKIEEAKKFIIEHDLIKQIAMLDLTDIEIDIFLYASPEKARQEHIIDFFHQIVKFGFGLSRKYNMDIVLPGSFVSSDTITLFSSRASKTTIKKNRHHIKIGDPVHGYVSIIPKYNVGDIRQFCRDNWKETFEKSLATGYYTNVGQLAFCQYNISYSVELIHHTYVCLRGHENREEQKKLRVFAGEFPRLYIQDWYAGISSMLDYAPELPRIEVLSDNDVKKLTELVDMLRKFQTP